MYYFKRFNLQMPILNNEYMWLGYFDCLADKADDLPADDEISGSFWVEKTDVGWQGRFTLNDGHWDRRKKTLDILEYAFGVPYKNINGRMIDDTGSVLVHGLYKNGKYVPNNEIGTIPKTTGKMEDVIKSSFVSWIFV